MYEFMGCILCSQGDQTSGHLGRTRALQARQHVASFFLEEPGMSELRCTSSVCGHAGPDSCEPARPNTEETVVWSSTSHRRGARTTERLKPVWILKNRKATRTSPSDSCTLHFAWSVVSGHRHGQATRPRTLHVRTADGARRYPWQWL